MSRPTHLRLVRPEYLKSVKPNKLEIILRRTEFSNLQELVEDYIKTKGAKILDVGRYNGKIVYKIGSPKKSGLITIQFNILAIDLLPNIHGEESNTLLEKELINLIDDFYEYLVEKEIPFREYPPKPKIKPYSL